MALEANIRPVTAAAERTSRAALLLGTLGLAAAAFVVVRLFESWRVTPAAASQHITVLGLRLSYPTANADAIVVVALAAVGLAVLTSAVSAMARRRSRSRCCRGSHALSCWRASRRRSR